MSVSFSAVLRTVGLEKQEAELDTLQISFNDQLFKYEDTNLLPKSMAFCNVYSTSNKDIKMYIFF